jgi:hypothetical protein
VRRDDGRYRLGIVAVAFLLLVVNSWSWALVSDAASNAAQNNETQNGLLKAMAWLNSTSPSRSQVVSVTDNDFNYYGLLYVRPSGYAPLATPNDVVASTLGSSEPTYVVLTRVATLVLTDPSLNPFILYPNDTRFTLQYNSSGVLIYKLGK